MTAWAIEALLASAALIALVLALRVPVRRLFGPSVGYALWALPALRLLLPPLPAGWLHPDVPVPLAEAGERLALLILPPVEPHAGPPVVALLLVAAWCAGAALFLAWQLVAYVRFTRRIAQTGVELGKVGRIALVVSDAVTDPLAYGLARPVVAVPRDFRTRYGAQERELALAHEVAHHNRGDMAANWLALAVLALHWFNPLAWIAFRAFRVDQEMANDAHVLAHCGADERHAYACAILKAATGRAPAAACGLHTIYDLKGRLRMLSHSTSPGRRVAGAAMIAGATLGLLGVTASGSRAAETVRAQVEQATGVPLASLAPTALLQSEPPTPPAPVEPPASVAGTRHVHAVKDGRTAHVTVTEDGNTRHYEGAEAEAWMAAHPVPAPPAPPEPGEPPVAAVAPEPPTAPNHHAMKVIVRDRYGDIRSRDFGVLARFGDMPRIESLDCPEAAGDRRLVLNEERDGRRRVIICTDRVAAAAADASRAARAALAASGHARSMRRDALRSALDGLRATRHSMAGERDMAEWERQEVIETLERSIRRLEQQLDTAS